MLSQPHAFKKIALPAAIQLRIGVARAYRRDRGCPTVAMAVAEYDFLFKLLLIGDSVPPPLPRLPAGLC